MAVGAEREGEHGGRGRGERRADGDGVSVVRDVEQVISETLGRKGAGATAAQTEQVLAEVGAGGPGWWRP